MPMDYMKRQGFRQISDELPEDGIPHVKMLLTIPTSEDSKEV